MNFKKSNILKVSILATVLSLGALGVGYAALKKDVTLVVAGKEINTSTFKNNVSEFLEEQNVEYDSNDIISIGLDSKIKDGSNIEVIDVKEDTIRESKSVPFDINIVEDSSLLKGKTKVESEGKSGKNELVYKITYHNGKQVNKKFIEEVVSVEPVNKIVKKGTKVEVQVASSRGGSSRNGATSTSNRKHMKVVATAYSGHSITATGTKPKWGTIAVDPKIIPYGTKVYIPQFDKTFIAEDCGGAIKGNKIDIFMEDSSKVNKWGRKTIEIYIVG